MLGFIIAAYVVGFVFTCWQAARIVSEDVNTRVDVTESVFMGLVIICAAFLWPILVPAYVVGKLATR